MVLPIGIVACSAPGAALCYQTICAEGQELMGPHEHPEISLHTWSLAEHIRYLEAGDWAGVGRMLSESVSKLASIGAKLAICPDNTAHQALDLNHVESPIPWLHIAEVVAQEARRSGVKRLGILGTRYLMEGAVYPDKLAPAGIDWCIPNPQERALINELIFSELVYGRVTATAQSELRRIIDRLRLAEGCDAVVLACTELPLAVTGDLSPLPALDSTRLLARAALARSVAPPAAPAADP